MTTSAIAPTSAAAAPRAQATPSSAGFAALGQEDFLRLLTTQMQLQDPFDPVDNKEMLAQMAQFSSLAGISETNETLQAIAAKLDAVMAAQASAAPPASTEIPVT